MNKKRNKILFLTLFLLINVVFIDFVFAETYNNYSDEVLNCGKDMLTNIPSIIPKLTSMVYTLIQIAIPVILVILGLIDLVKGITASKEDDIKKGQNLLIKRLITASLIFFVFAVVKFVISLVADDARVIDCAECFINNKCSDVIKEPFVCKFEGFELSVDSDGACTLKAVQSFGERYGTIQCGKFPKNSSDCSNYEIKKTRNGPVYDVTTVRK